MDCLECFLKRWEECGTVCADHTAKAKFSSEAVHDVTWCDLLWLPSFHREAPRVFERSTASCGEEPRCQVPQRQAVFVVFVGAQEWGGAKAESFSSCFTQLLPIAFLPPPCGSLKTQSLHMAMELEEGDAYPVDRKKISLKGPSFERHLRHQIV